MINSVRVNKIWILLITSMFLFPILTQARIISAKSASQQDVATAIDSSIYGDIIKIPPSKKGDYKWTSGIVITKDIKIIGAGIDSTTLTLDFINNMKEEAFFKFIPDKTSRSNLDNLNDTNTFEVRGITFSGNNRMEYKYGIWVDNYNTPAIRRVIIDSCKFTSVIRAVHVKGYVHGVFYHNTCFETNGAKPQGAGQASFSNDRMRLGLGDGWYIEDNIFLRTSNTQGSVCGAANDGGGYVVRYNTLTGEMDGGDVYVETHGNQLAGIIGPQITEIYGNYFVATGVGGVTAVRGGKNIYIYNVFADPDIEIWEEFSDIQTSQTYPIGRCVEPGQDKGRQNCTDDCICQKVHDSYFLNNRLNTVTGTILQAKVTMDFENREQKIINSPPEVVADTEFFNHKTPFDGSSGVGCGTLANRPKTCSKGVGYWATNKSCTDMTGMVGANPTNPLSDTLYKCTETNVWTAWYTPYTYPHPLRPKKTTNSKTPQKIGIKK